MIRLFTSMLSILFVKFNELLIYDEKEFDYDKSKYFFFQKDIVEYIIRFIILF